MADMMPAAFIGHGNPMVALERNRFTRAWSEFATSIPRPSGILAISAHWYVNTTAVTAMAKPRTIHDFSGFPDELFAIDYPAPGDPDLARRVTEVAGPTDVDLDTDSWGLDHGTWSVLTHMFPKADIPVVQLSINATEPLAYHLALGRALYPLRSEGVLIVASGNVVHNLGMIDWSLPGAGADWAIRFDDDTRTTMNNAPGNLELLVAHPDAALAMPTPDHFLPLAYIAGLADAASTTARTMIEGYDLGSLSMTSFVVDR